MKEKIIMKFKKVKKKKKKIEKKQMMKMCRNIMEETDAIYEREKDS